MPPISSSSVVGSSSSAASSAQGQQMITLANGKQVTQAQAQAWKLSHPQGSGHHHHQQSGEPGSFSVNA